MAYQTFRQEYMQMPPVTRAYTTACVITTIAVVRVQCSQFFFYLCESAVELQPILGRKKT